MDTQIEFLKEDTDYEVASQSDIHSWLVMVAGKHKQTIRHISYIICSDEYLLKLNQETFDHDYYTDVITLDYSPEGSNEVMGDIFISIDRVRENAESFSVNHIDELHRVMVHGLLHLLGFDDKSEESAQIMRTEEDLSLNLRMF